MNLNYVYFAAPFALKFMKIEQKRMKDKHDQMLHFKITKKM